MRLSNGQAEKRAKQKLERRESVNDRGASFTESLIERNCNSCPKSSLGQAIGEPGTNRKNSRGICAVQGCRNPAHFTHRAARVPSSSISASRQINHVAVIGNVRRDVLLFCFRLSVAVRTLFRQSLHGFSLPIWDWIFLRFHDWFATVAQVDCLKQSAKSRRIALVP